MTIVVSRAKEEQKTVIQITASGGAEVEEVAPPKLAQGNQAKAASWLGVTRTNMPEKLACFGLRPAGEPSEQP